jgi:hypothetical protein
MRSRTACRSLALALLCVVAGSGCTGTREQLFVAVGDGGGQCPGGTAGRPLAEWRANGSTRDEQSCPPWHASIVGQVPYGPGREGQAWYFRSQRVGGPDDPNYVSVAGSAGTVFRQVTVDALVRQVGFNSYRASDRTIASSGWDTVSPPNVLGAWDLYVHENAEVYFYFRVGTEPVADVDYATCPMRAAQVPDQTWVRYTGTYDGQFVRCYRDTVLVSSIALPAHLVGPIGDIVIGRNYPGDVDAVRVFDVALSDTQIARRWP